MVTLVLITNLVSVLCMLGIAYRLVLMPELAKRREHRRTRAGLRAYSRAAHNGQAPHWEQVNR